MPALRQPPVLLMAALLATAFPGCLFGSGEDLSADKKALQKNRSQRETWRKKAGPYYQYSLSYRENLLEIEGRYAGSCRVAPDTSFCDLVRRDEEHEIIARISWPPAIEGFFYQTDSMIGMSPPPSLFAADPVSDTLRITRDSLLYWVVVPDSTREPPLFWPFGVVVAYDSARGFPRTILRTPLGPSFEITNFEEIPPE